MLTVNQLIGFGAGGDSGLQFVGKVVDTARASATVSLTSLAGGIASQPAAGDIVLVFSFKDSTTNQDFAITGYTEILDVALDGGTGTDDAQFGVHYKIMTATPDTSFNKKSQYDDAYAYVFRGVNPTTPQDATATTDSKSEADVTPAPITTVTPGAVVIIVGCSNSPTLAAPTGYTNSSTHTVGDTKNLVCFKALPAAGLETPGAAYTGTNFGEIYFGTIALRPAT